MPLSVRDLCRLVGLQPIIPAPELGLLFRHKFPAITTYDSSKAPTGSSKAIVLARIDLPSIQERLEKVAADVFQNDPGRLRARIAELERAAKSASAPAAEVKTVEVMAISDEQIAKLHTIASQFGDGVQSIMRGLSQVKRMGTQIVSGCPHALYRSCVQ